MKPTESNSLTECLVKHMKISKHCSKFDFYFLENQTAVSCVSYFSAIAIVSNAFYPVHVSTPDKLHENTIFPVALVSRPRSAFSTTLSTLQKHFNQFLFFGCPGYADLFPR